MGTKLPSRNWAHQPPLFGLCLLWPSYCWALVTITHHCSQGSHIGRSSPDNKYECVRWQWPIRLSVLGTHGNVLLFLNATPGGYCFVVTLQICSFSRMHACRSKDSCTLLIVQRMVLYKKFLWASFTLDGRIVNFNTIGLLTFKTYVIYVVR